MGTNNVRYVLKQHHFLEIGMSRVLAAALSNPLKQNVLLFPITTSTHESRLTVSKPERSKKCALGAHNFSQTNHHYGHAAYSAKGCGTENGQFVFTKTRKRNKFVKKTKKFKLKEKGKISVNRRNALVISSHLLTRREESPRAITHSLSNHIPLISRHHTCRIFHISQLRFCSILKASNFTGSPDLTVRSPMV